MDKTSMIAINKWVFFCFNYPYDFISKVWADNKSLAEHLQGKFMTYYDLYGSRAVVNTFYCSLDGENKQRLMDWVLNNYDDEQHLRFSEPSVEQEDDRREMPWDYSKHFE